MLDQDEVTVEEKVHFQNLSKVHSTTVDQFNHSKTNSAVFIGVTSKDTWLLLICHYITNRKNAGVVCKQVRPSFGSGGSKGSHDPPGLSDDAAPGGLWQVRASVIYKIPCKIPDAESCLQTLAAVLCSVSALLMSLPCRRNSRVSTFFENIDLQQMKFCSSSQFTLLPLCFREGAAAIQPTRLPFILTAFTTLSCDFWENVPVEYIRVAETFSLVCLSKQHFA